jgi:hypothetical protein
VAALIAVGAFALPTGAEADLTKMDLAVEGDSHIALFQGKIFANRDCRKGRRVQLFTVTEAGVEKLDHFGSQDFTDKFGEFSMRITRPVPGDYLAKVSRARQNGETCARGVSDTVTFAPTR